MGIPITARAPVTFWPPDLLEKNDKLAAEDKPTISIIVRVPTMYQRDVFDAELVRGGVVTYSQRQVRDLMLAGIAELYPQDDFEKLRGQIEEMWAVVDAQKKCQSDRQDLYLELMEKQVALPPDLRMSTEEIEAELNRIQPSVAMKESDRVQINAIHSDVVARYGPMQRAFADLAEQEMRRNWICVETYVQGWTGLEHTPDGNGRGGLQKPEAEYLRSQLGARAFGELADFIFAMHSIDGEEEKNLASLIENASARPGSRLAESMERFSNGISTDEPSTETPEIESPPTTAPSSTSGKRSARKRGSSAPTQTAAP